MVECSICGKVFKYESECRRHELSHLPRYNCDCGKKFTYLSALRRHQKQHERKGSIECDKCNHSFKDEALLKRHIKYAHDGTYICSECNAKFNSNQALGIHKLTHKPKSERKYICSFKNCNKTFNFSHQLKYHEMTHTNTKLHFCKTCKKGFIQAHNLKVHMKIHEPGKWFPCEFVSCNKKFPSEYARKRHHARHKKLSNEGGLSDGTLNMTGTNEDNFCSINVKTPVPSLHQKYGIKENDNKIIQKFVIYSKEEESQKDVLHNCFRDPDEVMTCKAILGKCLVTGDTSINENCLCNQMVKSENGTKTPKVLEVNNEQFSANTYTSNNTSEKSKKITTCEDCSCNSFKCEKSSEIKINDNKISTYNSCLPDFEYGKNGTVKVINTVDIDFEYIVMNNNNNIMRKIDFNEQTNDTKTIPYNSCKAVLGKCIVSENGMMNEDCLCAKMAVDEPEMTSQEIDEITPQCYEDSCMCL